MGARVGALGAEATTGFEPVIGVLQTPALPLGHVAGAVTWPVAERKTRFELATPSLARRCSTAELLPRLDPTHAPTRLAGHLVPTRRFELLRPKGHHPLKMACLPIPPPRLATGAPRTAAGVEG